MYATGVAISLWRGAALLDGYEATATSAAGRHSRDAYMRRSLRLHPTKARRHPLACCAVFHATDTPHLLRLGRPELAPPLPLLAGRLGGCRITLTRRFAGNVEIYSADHRPPGFGVLTGFVNMLSRSGDSRAQRLKAITRGVV